MEKKRAENEYNILKERMNDALKNMNENLDLNEIQLEMDLLKKKFIYIRKDQIEMIKNLFDCYGADYIVADGEADEMCAYMALKGNVWACLSEDMDLFVYGVPRILRYISFVNHNVVVYDLNKILNDLVMTQNELREICILSGTDYNIQNPISITLFDVVDLFKKYKSINSINTMNSIKISFYEWLMQNNSLSCTIDSIMIDRWNQIKNLFEIDINENIEIRNMSSLSPSSCIENTNSNSLSIPLLDRFHQSKNRINKNLESILSLNGFLF